MTRAHPSRSSAARLILGVLAAALAHAPAAAQRTAAAPALELRPCTPPGMEEEARCGVWNVPENRETAGGRTLPLRVTVLPARSRAPRPDPIFYAAGGPGQTIGDIAGAWARSPWREERDIVLVDQRGTGPGHALDCRLPGRPDNPQGYLEPMFQPEVFRECRRELEARADLARYLTMDHVDDLDEVRRALGYDRINVMGGSYGTRVVLAYLRRYPRHVRTAFATGVLTSTARNPLHHARDSQAALDSVFALCARDAGCGAAFPRLRGEFAEIMDRLRRSPARVAVTNPATREPAEVTLDAAAFAEGLRVMMYSWERSRRLPLLLHRAHGGDYRPFAEAALASNAGLRNQLRFGLLMSVICAEDVPRITDADVVRETAGTFLGDTRVGPQRASCAGWPRRPLPPGHADPVVSDVPTLLVSGAYDPATGPRWASEAARTLRRSLHVVVPGGHTPNNPCVAGIVLDFLERGGVDGLDTSCAAGIRLDPFVLEDEAPR